jgi:hypothetical protein
MASGLHPIQAFPACSGPAVVLGRRQGDPAPIGGDLALATVVAELDAAGPAPRVIVLRTADRGDAEWVEHAVGWLAARGRRPIVRTAVPLPRGLVDAVRRAGATVLLEIAHPEPAMQRALLTPLSLGSGAESAASLLFFAQHLRACDIEIAAVIGPLLPAVHDERVLEAMMQHIAAADLVDVHVTVGRLSAARFAALAEAVEARELPWPTLAAAARAFGVDPSAPELGDAGVRLPAPLNLALRRAAERLADHVGLRIDACGCAAQCQLDPEERPPFVSVLTSDLFPAESA